jgi:hypothetical protein
MNHRSTRLALATLALPALLAAACGSDDTTTEPVTTTTTTTTTSSGGGEGPGGGGSGPQGGGGSGATGGTGAAGPFDLADGSWLLTDASNTAGTISHDGALAITAAGVVWIAFAEPDSVDTSDQDILATSRSGATFAAAEPLTTDTAIQNAFPSLVADGETLHLVWSGYPEGDNDLYYATHDGSWSARTNLIQPFETSETRDDWSPSLALGPNGELAVAYLSAPTTEEPPEVRVLRIEGGVATGAPVTVIPVADGGCVGPRIAFDAAAKLHVVADCGPLFNASIYYATDASGSWQNEALAGGNGEDHTSPDLALDPDGETLHIVWQQWLSCTNGTCAELTYLRGSAGAFSEPVLATATPEDTEAEPRLAVDSAGRPVLLYSRMNADGMADIFVALSGDGTSFGPESAVTPGTDTTDEWMPYAITMHPVTGLPHLTYTAIVDGSDPLDTEVMHAEFVPTP